MANFSMAVSYNWSCSASGGFVAGTFGTHGDVDRELWPIVVFCLFFKEDDRE
jgi:hypothetical protein